LPTKSSKVSSRRLYRNLDRINKSVEKQAVKKVLEVSTAPLESEMKLLVRKKSGDLARSIETRVTVKRRDTYNAKVGPLGEHGWRAHFLEYGTEFAQKYPFIRPAWDARKHRVKDSIGAGIGAIVKGSIK
jgi:HK97 gp10 family phage protein